MLRYIMSVPTACAESYADLWVARRVSWDVSRWTGGWTGVLCPSESQNVGIVVAI